MNRLQSLVIALCLVLSGQIASAQDMASYRAYSLNSSLKAIVAASGTRAADARTVHSRPAVIQELQWRAPYMGSTSPMADPVREIAFSFYNDALYQVMVNYDRGRTEGLTDKDIIDSVSVTYGVPALPAVETRTPSSDSRPDSLVLARWESTDSQVTLSRGLDSSDVRLILVSKSLSTSAESAIREATRLDTVDAPRREAEERRKADGDATDAREKVRVANKAAFKP